jgi:hypothetical protein
VFNDCRRCDRRGEACQDCVVAIVEPLNGARYLEAEELRALRVLADAGVMPPLRSRSEPVDLPGSRESRSPGKPRQWAYPATKAS